jgi:hypothetical protein
LSTFYTQTPQALVSPLLYTSESTLPTQYRLIVRTYTAKMSDYEDEMDVDAPAADNSISFGGDSKKGKRSAANLPVEAEDSLPWYAASSIC